MEVRQVGRSETFFYSPFIADYYSDKFDDLRTYKPYISALGKAIEGKKSFSTEKRKTLVKDLFRQYAESDILTESTEVGTNIELLQRSDTFTITTGQQIHIGLGPLYVLYKIFDILAICNEARELYPDKHFVPVFWMASEDHDLEEIQDIPLFGKNYHWETSQKGPVGRMNTNGVSKIFDAIEEDFNLDIDQIEFVNICRDAYLASANLSIAFRKILHHYFADEGLIIMDADSEILKESFQKVLGDELQSKNFASLLNSTQRFESKGYKRQLIIRECNLFDMSSGDRLKISGEATKTDVKTEQNESSYNLSPNAALRPFYQEWILPNLVYVGGGSEVKYWMQLRGVFDNYSVPMPIVHLRTSCITFSRKSLGSLDVKKLPVLFKTEEDVIESENESLRLLNSSLAEKYMEIISTLKSYENYVAQNLNGYSLANKIAKISLRLEQIQSDVNEKFIKNSEQNVEINRMLSTKKKFFDKTDIQERKAHVIAHSYFLTNSTSTFLSHFGLKNPQDINLVIK